MTIATPYLRKQFGFFPDGQLPPWLPEFAAVCDTPIGRLYTGDNLPVQRVERGGGLAGLWLGWPIAPEAAEAQHGDLEAWIYAHSGSFIYVDLAGAEPRVFLDASATLSVLFDRRSGVTASSAWVALGPDGYRERFLPHQLAIYDVARHGWIPGGETAHADVVRIMANFVLHPLTGAITRHWTCAGLAVGADDEGNLAAIGADCRRTLHAVLDRHTVVQSLTAGNESRMLLAALGERAGEVRFFTVSAPSTRMDTEVSRRLSGHFGLLWSELPARLATPEQVARWRLTVGDCLTGANLAQHPTMDALGGATFVGGLGGEIGRAFLWRNWRDNTARPDPAMIALRLKLPQTSAVLHNFAAWMATVPAELDPIEIWELAYIELRMACWAFAQSYSNPELVPIAPLISRANFSRMLSLSQAVRRSQAMPTMIVARQRPVLLEIPINRYGDWRDARDKVHKAMKYVNTRIMPRRAG